MVCIGYISYDSRSRIRRPIGQFLLIVYIYPIYFWFRQFYGLVVGVLGVDTYSVITEAPLSVVIALAVLFWGVVSRFRFGGVVAGVWRVMFVALVFWSLLNIGVFLLVAPSCCFPGLGHGLLLFFFQWIVFWVGCSLFGWFFGLFGMR